MMYDPVSMSAGTMMVAVAMPAFVEFVAGL
jgi:hypothetical protein